MPYEFKTPTHVGDAELHALGHELLAMFDYAGTEHRPTSFLTLREHPERHYDTCPVCAYAKVPGGSFELIHDYKRHQTGKLPYLTAHVLAAHGVAGVRELFEFKQLRDLLNGPEHTLAKRIVDLTSGAEPDRNIGFHHEFVKGSHECKHCGDRLNLGAVTLLRGDERFVLNYLALHTLAVHGDPRWFDSEGSSGKIDLDALRKLLDSGNELLALGTRLAAILPFLGGNATPPAGLLVVEDPLRGLETCLHCNEQPNMGSFTLIQAKPSRQLNLPYVAVHSLATHGSAHYTGSLHQGVVDVRLLERMLDAT